MDRAWLEKSKSYHRAHRTEELHIIYSLKLARRWWLAVWQLTISHLLSRFFTAYDTD